MKYLYEALEKPTRLYIKQCPHCQLKYFGKSTAENIETYPGSGARWKNHLKKYGVKPIHLWSSNWYYNTSIIRFAIKFSRINKIVSSPIWANLKEENGLEGGFDHLNNGSKEHIERASLGGKNAVHNILGKGTVFLPNDERTRLLSKKANEVKRKKLKEDPEYKKEYYSKVSDYQKANNSMKDRNWCVPISCKDKSKEMKVFHKDCIPDGWITCKEFNELKKNKTSTSYGKMWIYNLDLRQNSYINKDTPIPEGWVKGRKMKF